VKAFARNILVYKTYQIEFWRKKSFPCCVVKKKSSLPTGVENRTTSFNVYNSMSTTYRKLINDVSMPSYFIHFEMIESIPMIGMPG
jgi:hypothetical protein